MMSRGSFLSCTINTVYIYFFIIVLIVQLKIFLSNFINLSLGFVKL